MRSLTLFLTLIVILVTSCTTHESADGLLKKSVEAHGGDLYKNSIITYTFRDRSYKLVMDSWKFKYERSYSDTAGTNIIEGMNNSGAYKLVGGEPVELSVREDSLLKYSINAVRYFSVLPLQLINSAVLPEIIGESEINGKAFYKLQLTFEQKGGGDDYRDRYVLWINKNSYLLEYFAYYYHVNGGGSRFREMVNTRVAGGLTLSDQINYTSDKITSNIEDYDLEFQKGELKEVSRVILENLNVKRN